YLSFILFQVRVGQAKYKPAHNRNKAQKIPTHRNNAQLHPTAGARCVTLSQYPFEAAWVTAKLLGLIAYVVLGVIAIKKVNVKAFVLAIVVFVYLFGVAKAHSALSWVGMLIA
ncbi:SirB2 family protein, partial [Thalassolituus sp.]|uniref:SirB2 family protein n=1 Tax=Thalassolituus sp. TaxID=2030822 RepID=UPI0027D5A53D